MKRHDTAQRRAIAGQLQREGSTQAIANRNQAVRVDLRMCRQRAKSGVGSRAKLGEIRQERYQYLITVTLIISFI
jgi:hypothetical protein